MQSLIGKRPKSAATQNDPAPSRWSYRVQRLMLTPGVRTILRAGIPFFLTLGAASFYLADQDRRDQIWSVVAEARNSFETRPEFMVNLMAVDGAGRNVAEIIRDVVPIEFPVTSFDLDLAEIRKTISALAPVKDVTVRVRPGGILQVDVIERQPVVLWRTYEGLHVLDGEGVRVGATFGRNDWPELPVMAGIGADEYVSQALELIATAAPLAARLRGIVRVGERRWDVVLDRGQRILLPETNPRQALERVIALNQAQDILARDLSAVDMRISARPTLRMNENAIQEWWRIQQISDSGFSQ